MHVAGIGGSHADVASAKQFYMDLGLPQHGPSFDCEESLHQI